MQPAIQVMSVVAIGVAGWLSSSALRGFKATVAGVPLSTYDTILGLGGLLITVCGLGAMIALRGTDQPVEPSAEKVTAEPAT